MPKLQAKSFANPDLRRPLTNAEAAIVNFGDQSVGKSSFAPGWRWSTDLRSVAGTASCPLHHLGYSVSGLMRVQLDDGQTLDCVLKGRDSVLACGDRVDVDRTTIGNVIVGVAALAVFHRLDRFTPSTYFCWLFAAMAGLTAIPRIVETRTQDADARGNALALSTGWILSGLAAALVFVALLGPGIDLTS